jgi:hypothetical protein
MRATKASGSTKSAAAWRAAVPQSRPRSSVHGTGMSKRRQKVGLARTMRPASSSIRMPTSRCSTMRSRVTQLSRGPWVARLSVTSMPTTHTVPRTWFGASTTSKRRTPACSSCRSRCPEVRAAAARVRHGSGSGASGPQPKSPRSRSPGGLDWSTRPAPSTWNTGAGMSVLEARPSWFTIRGYRRRAKRGEGVRRGGSPVPIRNKGGTALGHPASPGGPPMGWHPPCYCSGA